MQAGGAETGEAREKSERAADEARDADATRIEARSDGAGGVPGWPVAVRGGGAVYINCNLVATRVFSS